MVDLVDHFVVRLGAIFDKVKKGGPAGVGVGHCFFVLFEYLVLDTGVLGVHVFDGFGDVQDGLFRRYSVYHLGDDFSEEVLSIHGA